MRIAGINAVDVSERFRPAVRAVEGLSGYDRYVGALVFGSVARGTAGATSDLDARVLVADDNPCRAINHPLIGGVKLDITFGSLSQLGRQIEEEIADGRRAPMIAGALILFDKTGRLAGLKRRADAAQPPACDAGDAGVDRFMLYHANDKVQRALTDDPASALWSMHATVNDVVAIHYRRSGRFGVSSKRLLADLEGWDAPLAELLRRFVRQAELQRKYAVWSAIIDHVSVALGGRPPIEENVCVCSVCTEGLAALQAAVGQETTAVPSHSAIAARTRGSTTRSQWSSPRRSSSSDP